MTFPRTICPQLRGIYRNTDEPKTYAYLLIEEDDPNEMSCRDAFPCDVFGRTKKNIETPVPFLAKQFGEKLRGVEK